MYQVPLVMGHEFAGEIVELGENITDFKIGDKATGVSVYDASSYASMKPLGVMVDGGFAEYVRVPSKYLFHTPKNISLKECSLIESYAVVVRALKNAKIKKGQKIAIIGAGTIGLTTLQLVSEWDPKYVIIIEPNEYSREIAREIGATETFPPSKVKLNRFFKKHGKPALIFECAGNEKALNFTFDIIERGGTIVLESIYKGSVKIPIFMLNAREIALKGTISHEREDILDAIKLLDEKKVDPSKLISEIVPLKELQKTFERFLEPGKRKFIKIVVEI